MAFISMDNLSGNFSLFLCQTNCPINTRVVGEGRARCSVTVQLQYFAHCRFGINTVMSCLFRRISVKTQLKSRKTKMFQVLAKFPHNPKFTMQCSKQ